MRSHLLTAVLLASFTSGSLAAQDRHPDWSVDLHKYGYPKGPTSAASALSSDDVVAATDAFVAVALDTSLPKTHPARQSTLSVLIFETHHGKLSAKCGPWIVNGWFDLWPTASGNFLLHLAPFSDSNSHSVETLLLISPTCAQLKQITPGDEGTVSRILQSPSRQTMLLVKEREEGNGYELRSSDTLDLKKQWFERNSEAPIIVALSDKGFLGVLPKPSSMVSETRPISDYYRTFDGNWRILSVSNYYSFLSDAALVGTRNSVPESWSSVSKIQTTAVGLDGTSLFAATVSGVGYHVERSSEISVSSDGSHFASVFHFSAAGWFWGNLDIGPEHRSAYVWSVANASPCAKIKLENWLDHPSLALSFSPDGSWFAVLLGDARLSVHPLP